MLPFTANKPGTRLTANICKKCSIMAKNRIYHMVAMATILNYQNVTKLSVLRITVTFVISAKFQLHNCKTFEENATTSAITDFVCMPRVQRSNKGQKSKSSKNRHTYLQPHTPNFASIAAKLTEQRHYLGFSIWLPWRPY